MYPPSTPAASSSSPTPTGEVEEEGVSETDSAESVTGAGEGGEDFGEVDEGAAGEGEGQGSQGEEEGQIAEEETQGEQNEGENGGVEESLRPNGNVTDQGEDGGDEGGGEGGSNYLVAAGSAYPCPDPGYFSLTGSCTEFWVCKEVGS